MRRFAAALAIGLLASCPTAYSQQELGQIDIGIKLRVGMAKPAVISQLSEKGYRVTQLEKTHTERYVIDQKKPSGKYETLGQLFFTNGVLTGAIRIWSSVEDPGSAKLARNLYLLVRSIEDTGNASCTLRSKSEEATNLDHKWIEIHCRNRTITVHVSKYESEEPTTSVEEAIE